MISSRMVIIKQQEQPETPMETKTPELAEKTNMIEEKKERELLETPTPVESPERVLRDKKSKPKKAKKLSKKKKANHLKKLSKKKSKKSRKLSKAEKKIINRLEKLMKKHSKGGKKLTKKQWGMIMKQAKNKKERKLWWWRRRRAAAAARRRREAARRRREAARRRREAARRRHQEWLRRRREAHRRRMQAHRRRVGHVLHKEELKYKVEIQRSRLRQLDRNKFDKVMEVGRKKDAEMWSRTFIYDAILLTEKLIYMEHEKMAESQRKLSVNNEQKAVKKLQTYYNKNFGKRMGELTEKDIEEDIFMEI
jgi:colicin import membrane protein